MKEFFKLLKEDFERGLRLSVHSALTVEKYTEINKSYI